MTTEATDNYSTFSALAKLLMLKEIFLSSIFWG